MIKNMRRWLWVCGVATGLGLAGSASAESTFQPFKGLFGPKTEQKAIEQKAPDANRQTEIQIELAWLSDRADLSLLSRSPRQRGERRGKRLCAHQGGPRPGAESGQDQ